MQKKNGYLAIGALALGIVAAGAGFGAVSSPALPLPITGNEVTLTAGAVGTASSLARPFSGALAANRDAAGAASAFADGVVAGSATELPAGVTARAALQQLADATDIPAAWR